MDTDNSVNKESIRRILIVDDHPLVRAGLASLIDGESDLEVCGQTDTVREAQDLIRRKQPDLAVIDLSLSDGNGLGLVKWLKAHHSGVKALVCSMHDEVLFSQRALNAGALGYINKQEATTDVVDAIRHVLRGKVWLSEIMTERMLQYIADGPSVLQVGSVASLSDRELEVFGLIGQGLGPTQIAEQLHLSVKTIETYREKIKKKLDLKSASELIRCAMQWVLEDN